VVPHTFGEDTIPGKEGEARVSDSSSLSVYQSNHVRSNDLAKLKRLLGYIRHTRTRGIVHVGRTMMVKAYIDAYQHGQV
jgi:hypothetical protein